MSSRESSILPERDQARARVFFRSKADYEAKLLKAQVSLLELEQRLHRKQRKLIIVLEGPDAAGKGGVIKRLTQRLDPRGVRVHSIAKPNVIEAREHYLERFVRRWPGPGEIAVFDRSWYGRVLVERVESLCGRSAWQRAYGEINAFEKLLLDDGVLVLKYFLDLTPGEQKARFKEREADPLKAWKLTPEDWRNRRQWEAYREAFQDMFRRTSPRACPWMIVPADSKWFARLAILRDIAQRTKRFY